MTCVFITKDGQSIALASQLDHLGLEQTETYDEVVDYGLDFEAGFFAMMERLAPTRSRSITPGMWLLTA